MWKIDEDDPLGFSYTLEGRDEFLANSYHVKKMQDGKEITVVSVFKNLGTDVKLGKDEGMGEDGRKELLD